MPVFNRYQELTASLCDELDFNNIQYINSVYRLDIFFTDLTRMHPKWKDLEEFCVVQLTLYSYPISDPKTDTHCHFLLEFYWTEILANSRNRTLFYSKTIENILVDSQEIKKLYKTITEAKQIIAGFNTLMEGALVLQ